MPKKSSATTRAAKGRNKAVKSKTRKRRVSRQIDIRLRILESRESMLKNVLISPAVSANDLAVGSFFIVPKNE